MKHDLVSAYDQLTAKCAAGVAGSDPFELHLLKNLALKGKRVLEVGLGQGADGEQIIRRGAVYSGAAATGDEAKRVKARFDLKGLEYETIRRASVLSLPFENNSFDIVYCRGVLHHVPDVRKASAEIARVLKPGGELIAMLYAKRSLNYLLSISVLRRLEIIGAYVAGARGNAVIASHLHHAKESGLFNYLATKNFAHRNIDWPRDLYSKVYSLREVKKDFREFTLTGTHRSFMHAPPLRVGWLPLASVLGWHLWVHLAPPKRSSRKVEDEGI